MALKDWKKSEVYSNKWYHKIKGITLKIEKKAKLFYVRIYNHSGFLLDSLAEGNLKNAKKSAQQYMRTH